MGKRVAWLFGGLVACVLTLSACPRQAEITPKDYFPLSAGSYWKYQLKTQNASQLLVFRIGDEGEGRRGEQRFGLEGKPDMHYVRRGPLVAVSVGHGVWTVLLNGDLDVGDTWPGAIAHYPEGETERVEPVKSTGTKRLVDKDVTIEVPAGTFERCIRVDHYQGLFHGVKYFAPGVGLVRVDLFGASSDSDTETLVSRQVLFDYHIE